MKQTLVFDVTVVIDVGEAVKTGRLVADEIASNLESVDYVDKVTVVWRAASKE